MPLTALAFFFRHIVLLAALASTAFVLGALATQRLPVAGRLERFVVASILGLALLSLALFFLALAGLLRAPVLLCAAVLIHAASWRAWREFFRGQDGPRRPRALPLLAAAALLPLFLLPLYPPTAFDATMYHLAYAQAFARENGLVFLPNLRFPVFPQSAELLFSSVGIFGGDTASQLVSLLATLLTALLLLARGRIGASREGLVAAAIWLGNPIVIFLAGTAYVEPCLVLFATGTIHAALRWKETGREGWLAVAGALAGAAAAVKYPGLFFAGALLLFAAVAGRRRGRALREVLVGSVCLLAFLLPTYGRIVAETGNPVFPFLPEVFGKGLWSLEGYEAVAPDSVPALDGRGARGVLPGLLGLLRLPFDAVFERDRWGGQPPISPVYLLTLPLVVVTALRGHSGLRFLRRASQRAGGVRGVSPRLMEGRPWPKATSCEASGRQSPAPTVSGNGMLARRVLLFSAAVLLASIALPRDVRFVLPLLPLWSFAGARALLGGVRLLPTVVSRRASAGLLAGLLALPGFLYSLYALRRAGPLPVTPPARERYLARHLPLYPAIAFLNRSFGAGWTAYAFHAERMASFAEGVLWGDWFGPGSYRRMLAATVSGEALAAEMRRLGARYLIIPEAQGLRLPDDAFFRSVFRQIYRDRAARIFELRGPGIGWEGAADHRRRPPALGNAGRRPAVTPSPTKPLAPLPDSQELVLGSASGSPLPASGPRLAIERRASSSTS